MRWMLAAVATVAALPIAAHAQTPVSYTYAEVGYVNVDVDENDIDGNGFALRGSYAIQSAKPLFIYGEIIDAELDFDIDFTNMELGLGGHVGIERGIDLVGRIGINSLEIGRDEEDGFALALGLRGKATGNFEFEGLVRYVDLGSDIDDTSLRGEGRYFFTRNASAGVLLELGDELTTFGVFGRVTF